MSRFEMMEYMDHDTSINEYAKIHLYMKQIVFLNFTMSKEWFTVLKPIKSIRISSCSLSDIGPNSFASTSFENMTSFEIDDTPIEVLHEGTFNGLTNFFSLYRTI